MKKNTSLPRQKKNRQAIYGLISLKKKPWEVLLHFNRCSELTPGSYVRNSLISQSCGVIIKAMLSCRLGLRFKKASHSRKPTQHS